MGVPRLFRSHCNVKSIMCSPREEISFSCEACDFDICKACVYFSKLKPAEKRAKETEIRDRKRRQEIAAKQEMQNRMEKRRKKICRIEDEKKKISKEIREYSNMIKIPPKAPNRDKTKPLEFVVWFSDGYGNDGWHSYDGPPTKYFDSSFSSKSDANKRALYKFYKKNPWGLDVEEMLEQDTKCKFDHGLHYLQVTPDDSSTYTVGVVPAAAFKHLDNVGNSDDELSEEGSSPGIW
mmetsp:Transcript_28424/g.46254  ORF Transcript_28424/g.46254 Transcript_28424/m.46254 type:complete len:236 (-) Transcript_28424:442-1149(-)